MAVEIESRGGVIPAKADRIDLQVQGLDEFLRLYHTGGAVCQYWGGDTEKLLRRASIDDAQRWQLFIQGLQQH